MDICERLYHIPTPLSSAVTPLATVAHPAAVNPVILLPWLVVMRGLKCKHLREGLNVHTLKYAYAAIMKRDVGSGSMVPYIHLGTKCR